MMKRAWVWCVLLTVAGCNGKDSLPEACLELDGELPADGSFTGDTTGASDLLDSSCPAEGPEELVYFTAPEGGTYTVSATGYDTVLSVWDGCDPTEAVELGCNDDGPSGPSSVLTFTAVADQTVMIAVEGFQGATGAYTLEFGEGPIDTGFIDPCIDNPDSDGDGVDAVECGGDDCDDFDPNVQDGTDADGDGYLVECGFPPDCDDTDDQIPADGPDTPGDGIDSDCDGADAMETCTTEGARDGTSTGTLDCGTFDIRPYDVWEVSVTEGDCVDLFADNDKLAADLLGFVFDGNGVSGVVGLAAGGFDDNVDCTVTPHNSFRCPAATVTAVSTGTMRIGIGQFGEPAQGGCVDGAGYTLSVAVNGTTVTPTLADDDVDLAPQGEVPARAARRSRAQHDKK